VDLKVFFLIITCHRLCQIHRMGGVIETCGATRHQRGLRKFGECAKWEPCFTEATSEWRPEEPGDEANET
jgi:hypothetical protein